MLIYMTYDRSVIVTKKSTKSRNPHKITQPYDLFENSQHISNNTNAFKNIMQSRPSYLDQFDDQIFDASEPVPHNTVIKTKFDHHKNHARERDMSFNNGYSYTTDSNTAYGIVPEEQFKTPDMFPSFNVRQGYGSNDIEYVKNSNYKNDLFTGKLNDTWINKKETGPRFNPSFGAENIYGTPVMSDYDRSRFQPSIYNTDKAPFEQISVTPGIGIGYDGIGKDGFHPTYRPPVKTIDELCVNPKQVYEGRIIEGQRGTNRPIQPDVISYKAPRFVQYSGEEMVPSYHNVTGPKSSDNFILDETKREPTHIEYTGGAYNKSNTLDKNIPEHMKEKHRNSNRVLYSLPEPMQKYSGTETTYNPDTPYSLNTTSREISTNNHHINLVGNDTRTYAYSGTPIQNTSKDLNTVNKNTYTNIVPNTLRGTAHNFDIANPTIKETTINNRLNPFVSDLNHLPTVYNTDDVRTTMKEITPLPILPVNIGKSNITYTNISDPVKTTTREIANDRLSYMAIGNRNTIYADIMDNARNTNKEQLLLPNQNRSFVPMTGSVGPSYKIDTPESTNKELTIDKQRLSHINLDVKNSQTPLNDTSRNTLREQYSNNIFNPMMDTTYHRNYRTNNQDIANTTNKESTVQIPYHNIINPAVKKNISRSNEPTKTTIKEQLSQTEKYITPSVGTNIRVNDMDVSKKTMRETINIPYSSVIHGNSGERGKTHSFNWNEPDITTKDQNIYHSKQNNLETSNRGIMTNNNIPLRTTNKESNLRSTGPISINSSQGITINNNDIARSTTKESYLDPMGPRTINLGQGITSYNNDIAKTTNKESYLNSMDPRTINLGQGITINNNDIAKTTNKESYLNSVGPRTINLGQGITSNNNDIARTTNKESYLNSVGPRTINLGQGITSYNNDITKTTNKESTIVSMGPRSIKLGQGIITNNNDIARNTNKELVSYNNIGQINNPSKSIRLNNSIPVSTTMKEQNIQNQFANNVSGNNGILVDNNDPLRTTLKESSLYHNISQINNSANSIRMNGTDAVNTTIKEQAIHIPYGGQIGRNNVMRNNLSDNAKNTTKELTIHNNHSGGIELDVINKGHGYLAESPTADTTKKEMIIDKKYIQPLFGSLKNRTYDGEYNAVIDDKKEKTQIYHSPTNSNVNLGPTHVNNMYGKSDSNNARTPNQGYIFDPLAKRSIGNVYTKNPLKESDRTISRSLKNQLNENPYNIEYYG